MRSLVLLVGLTLPLVAQTGPVNLDFEDSGLDGIPTGWAWNQDRSSLTTVETCRRPDSRCAQVRHLGDANPSSIMQSFDATALRGKQVRYRAWLQLEAPTLSQARLFMRVERAGGMVGFQEYSYGDRIRSRDWTMREIVGTIDEDATRVTIGLFYSGLGSAYIADAEIIERDGL